MILLPEHQLMVRLVSGDASREEVLETITTQNLSWKFFLEELTRHGVGPLISEEVHRLDLEDILPPTTVQGLKATKDKTAFQNFFLFEETKAVVKHLSELKVQTILFKGSSLSGSIYKNIALRPCSDVDMLVPRDSLETVKNTFFSLGFHFPPDLMDERFYYQNHFHIPFHKTLTHTSILIEVHWNLMDKYLLGATNIAEIWERKKIIQFEGIDTFGLSQEDELIYLSLHILKHGYMNIFIAALPSYLPYLFHPTAENKLLWFVDLKKILETQKNIDWDFLIKNATRWGVLESIRPIFLLLKLLFPHTDIPQNFLKPETPIKISWARKIIFKTLLSKSDSAFVRKHFLTMKGDLQFRLIRIFDIAGYMFPSYSTLSRLYPTRLPLFAIFFYPFHILKTISLALFGLFQWMIFRKGKETVLI